MDSEKAISIVKELNGTYDSDTPQFYEALDEVLRCAERYRWLKTATKEQLLAWRGVYGCSDMAIDEMLKN